jgi:hypothetical protein
MIEIVAWIGIVLGALVAVVNLFTLTAGRTRKRMTEPAARRDAGTLLRTGLLITAAGITLLGSESANSTIAWSARLLTFAIVGIALAVWLRSRIRGEPTDDVPPCQH